MATRYSILARNNIDVAEEPPQTEAAAKAAIDSEDVLSLRSDVRRLKVEIERLTAERDSAERGEREQRVRADRAERMCSGMEQQLNTASEQHSQLSSQLDQEKAARSAAEAVSVDRAQTNERLIAGIPPATDMAPLMAAVKDMATTIQARPASGPMPAFELHFKRGQNGLIQSPVTAIPKGG